MSVAPILVTLDNKIVLGVRGGHRYSDTIMTVPAGAIEYHSGENPLFETAYAEINEETGLTKEDISNITLIGRVFDHTLQRNSLYVFSAETKLTFAELEQHWNVSKDQMEHKQLIPLDIFPEGNIVNYVMDHLYHPDKINLQNPAATTSDNFGSLLPPGGISLLLYASKKDSEREDIMFYDRNYIFERVKDYYRV